MLRIFCKLFWGCMVDGKWSNREPRGVILPGCPAIKCPKIFDPLQTLTECIRSDYSGIQAGGGGSRRDSNGPGRISAMPGCWNASIACQAGQYACIGGGACPGGVHGWNAWQACRQGARSSTPACMTGQSWQISTLNWTLAAFYSQFPDPSRILGPAIS